jgi:biotin synthase
VEQAFYNHLAMRSIADEPLPRDRAGDILTSATLELLPLMNAAFEVRKAFFGNEVLIHILNNAQNGYCPEDCHYCAQSRTSSASIEEYPLKSDEEILAEAKRAAEKGASCYCMVFAGRGPSSRRSEHLARIIRQIKSQYPSLDVCVSAGLLDEEKAHTLKEAGLDRLNHNLNTSARHYPGICTTHTYEDRLRTLRAARQAGLRLCSGIIVGMGETAEDILEVAYTLREMNVESIPVNFYMPIAGNRLDVVPDLSPDYCLRLLCLFRFLNPKAEIRMAAGRELYLRDMQVMGLYPANSLFLDGYLNAEGDERRRVWQMIRDAGFTIRSEYPLEGLLGKEMPSLPGGFPVRRTETHVPLKGMQELRPCAYGEDLRR